jgi:Ala-tRNA(Pro) deacylase
MPVRALNQYLQNHDVNYRCYNHPPAVTAQEIAEMAHIPGSLLAKSVIVNADDELIMAVLPADQHVDLARLRSALGAHHVRLAEESEFQDRFVDCETGGMHALGHLYGMRVFLEAAFKRQECLAFNAGTHTEVIMMDVPEFIRLANPTVCGFIQLH